MSDQRTTDQRLTDLEEELATVKEDQTAMRIEMNKRFDEMGKSIGDVQDGNEGLNKKLDKILEVVVGKQAKVDERLTHLEHHRTHPPIVQ